MKFFKITTIFLLITCTNGYNLAFVQPESPEVVTEAVTEVILSDDVTTELPNEIVPPGPIDPRIHQENEQVVQEVVEEVVRDVHDDAEAVGVTEDQEIVTVEPKADDLKDPCIDQIKQTNRPLPPGYYLPDPCFKRPIVPEGQVDEPEGVTEAPVETLDPDNFNSSDASIGLVDSMRVFVGRASCQCGKTNQKIVGGEQASIHNYPWTAALVRKSYFGGGSRAYCGGTLINSNYVLTASHCVDGMKPGGIMVVLNQEAFSKPNANHRYDVKSIKMHERYNRQTVDYDIALIELARPAPLSSSITPACLPASNDNDFSGQTATVVGWGATSQGGTTSDHLRKVDVPIISNSVCNSDQTKYNGKITARMMCAGYINEGQKDSCQGDSGGPLTIPNGTRKTLVGVVSWGYGCAQPKSPGVYTRVGVFPDWILKNTKGADWCQG